MKHIKHLFFIALLLLCFTAANAHDFEAGGIYYNITDATNKTVEVTYAGTNYDSHEEYSGNIDIPKSVIYNDTRYSVTSIGENAFRYCPGVKSITIPGSITSIRGYAFYDCTGLTSITIPNSITSIEDFAFYGCTGIHYIYIEDGTETLSVGCNEKYDKYARRGLFYNCPLDSVYLGRNLSYSYTNNAFYINNSPFKDNTTLKRITLPDDMTSVNGGMFSGCTGLTSIELPHGVTVIGSGSFAGCTGLTSIELPYGVTVIESSSFSGCTGLTDITIPNSVTTIEGSAFCDCVNLTSITIPNSVTVIEHYTFSGCKGLKHIYLEDGTDELSFGKTSYNLGDELVDCPLETVYFGRNLNTRWKPFRGNKTLKSITIGSKVTTINYKEFYNCKGLTAITMANSVTSIGESAFSGCESITSITIPNSVITIKKYTFRGCI